MSVFTCIDQQHGEIAVEQLKREGRGAKLFGRVVLTDSPNDDVFSKIYNEAMAHEPKDFDLSQLEK